MSRKPVIEVTPGNLQWTAKVGERQSQKLTLRNPAADRDACYKIKTTRVARYAVLPGQALIPAGTTVEVEIVLIKMDELPASTDLRDRFLIQATWRDDPAEEIQALWKRGPKKDELFQKKLLSELLLPDEMEGQKDDELLELAVETQAESIQEVVQQEVGAAVEAVEAVSEGTPPVSTQRDDAGGAEASAQGVATAAAAATTTEVVLPPPESTPVLVSALPADDTPPPRATPEECRAAAKARLAAHEGLSPRHSQGQPSAPASSGEAEKARTATEKKQKMTNMVGKEKNEKKGKDKGKNSTADKKDQKKRQPQSVRAVATAAQAGGTGEGDTAAAVATHRQKELLLSEKLLGVAAWLAVALVVYQYQWWLVIFCADMLWYGSVGYSGMYLVFAGGMWFLHASSKASTSGSLYDIGVVVLGGATAVGSVFGIFALGYRLLPISCTLAMLFGSPMDVAPIVALPVAACMTCMTYLII